MRVIGTAGHVDHGKSTLVEALTGTHPDRLKEERQREMTIDLGFAWFRLPGGEEVGVIDVPGHRDFIENMLAGVGGIDAALFVVAADEGVMPQTREHLAILDILQIQGGVVALTKVDLIDEKNRSEWLELVEDEIRKLLARTVLAGAPVLPVSARTGEGISELKEALDACLAEKPPRLDRGRPRLPVDRVFTIAGFGTIVTGTLTDGRLQVGEEVQILPSGLRGRVRGLQTHKRKEEIAVPGSRTAVNLSGIDLDQVHRGDVIARPGDYQPTRRMDARFRLLDDAGQPLPHNTNVKLFLGSAEVVARLRLLGSEILQPGEDGWLQLEFEQPMVAVRGDRYILRRPSPGETLGGGVVVDPHPSGRHKRFSSETLSRLEALSKGTSEDILFQAVIALGAAPWSEVIVRSNLDEETAQQALGELISSGQVLLLDSPVSAPGDRSSQAVVEPESWIASLGNWEHLAARAVHEVEAYHSTYPLRRGMPREELKSRLKLKPPPQGRGAAGEKGPAAGKSELTSRLFNISLRKLVAEGSLQESGPLVLRPGHVIRFNPQQQSQVERLFGRFTASPYAPPSVKDCQAEVGEEIYNTLVELGELIPMRSSSPAPEVVFRKDDYDRMVAEVRALLQKQGTMTAAQVRDHFNTSRRYILAFLEYLDALGITVREGDFRRLKS